MMTTKQLELTPAQALGVALSCVMRNEVMCTCQALAPDMLKHIQNMGFDIVENVEAE